MRDVLREPSDSKASVKIGGSGSHMSNLTLEEGTVGERSLRPKGLLTTANKRHAGVVNPGALTKARWSFDEYLHESSHRPVAKARRTFSGDPREPSDKLTAKARRTFGKGSVQAKAAE